MKRFSVRPTLTLKRRTFKGLRGWSGKPLHPPLTDIPIAAYVLAAVFDVISFIGGDDRGWAHDFWRAGTYVFIGGAVVSVFAALTGCGTRGSRRRPGRRHDARNRRRPSRLASETDVFPGQHPDGSGTYMTG
ncbi:MAG: DUF2231 domain-containing protein [Ilumatobacter sp.]